MKKHLIQPQANTNINCAQELTQSNKLDHFIEQDGCWVWSEPSGQVPVETKGFVGSEVAVANGLVCEHLESPGWGPLNQVGQLIKGAGPHPRRAPHFNEHEIELRSEFD